MLIVYVNCCILSNLLQIFNKFNIQQLVEPDFDIIVYYNITFILILTTLK